MRYETRVVADGDGFDFQCACGFVSAGWTTAELAAARGADHTEEHVSAEPGRELVEFRAEHELNGPAIDMIRFRDEAQA